MTDQPIAHEAAPTTQRPLVVVSNRLPVRLEQEDGAWRATPSSGGLVTALRGLEPKPMWIGWPGADVPAANHDAIEEQLAHESLVPVFLGRQEEQLYYRGFCNTALWPLFHYFTSAVAYVEAEWRAYVEVNERFARTIAARAPEGARVWVHDFHLMLVPALLRQLRPDVEIGFFLHIPFPSSEVYRLLPRREELLSGLLGADYLGFHTSDYARHFRATCVRVLGLDVEWDRIQWQSRTIGIGVHPIGIDTAYFADVVQRPRTAELHAEYQKRFGHRRIVLGIERLDYTKGVGLKLEAFERFLQQDPTRVDDVALLQVLVPSRLDHPEYQTLKSQIEESIGRINGTYGKPGLMPVHYMHRSLEPEELVALYRLATVCLVTPVRDGMNLVAQEYVACQAASAATPDCSGALVLSEFAGAAHTLGRALLVNPWHQDQVAQAIAVALDMDADERRERMQTMARSVAAMDCNIWARGFCDALAVNAAANESVARCEPLGREPLQELQRTFVAARKRALFLDYDGTLREMASRPELAAPTDEIRSLLDNLAALPDTEVHLVSGRPRDTMARWFGSMPIHLCAEHGATWRRVGEDWRQDPEMDLSWMPKVRAILEEISREVPGTFVEAKSCALAWHYRMADVDYGPWRARELRARLDDELANLPTEVLAGRKVVEVRAAGINKGRYVARVLRSMAADAHLLCIGDDRTDLDMYPVLPAAAWTVHVGEQRDEARYVLETPGHVRSLLRLLVAGAAATGKAGRA